MNTCPNCGTQVPEGGLFCPSCGAAMTPAEPPAPPAPPAPVEPPVVEAASPQPPAPGEPPVPQPVVPQPPAPAEPPAPQPVVPQPPAPAEPPAPAPMPPAPAPQAQQAPPEPPPFNAPPQPTYAAAPPAEPPYQQPYPPAGPAAQPPKKSRKGLFITIAVVIILALLGCCVGGYLLFRNGFGSEDHAKVQAVETFAVGLSTMDFDKLKSVTQTSVHDDLAAIEELLATEGEDVYFMTLTSTSWEGDTVTLTFEDEDGYATYLKILPPDDGGTTLYTLDWDEDSTEADATETQFELIDDGGWKIYSLDGEPIESYFAY